ncbi:MAG: GGDEF domain-containing protein [Clostridiales bacterium]|nr:GGDEF domain-containing protein [Clostridiales bacterium]MBR5938057.1 GGDEF domain-containing protein [Clostridiales bacterium]
MMTFSYKVRKFTKFMQGVFAICRWKTLKEAATFIYLCATVFLFVVGLFLFSFLSFIMGYESFVPIHKMPRDQGLVLLTISLGMLLIDFLMGTFFVWLYDRMIMAPTENIIKEISEKTEKAAAAFPAEMRQLVEENPFIKVSTTGTWVDSIDKYITIAGNEKYYDETTGCFNRKYFQQVLSQMLKTEMLCDMNNAGTMKTYGSSEYAIFMIDIDHFKRINDEFGHQYGDVILALVGKTLRKIVANKGVVVRNGGEEFLLVVCLNYPESMESYAENVRAVFEKNVRITGQGAGKNRPVTCSIGYTPFPLLRNNPTGISVSDHVKIADQAMYLSKTCGRNTWRGIEAVRPPYSEDELQKMVESILYGEEERYIRILCP